MRKVHVEIQTLESDGHITVQIFLDKILRTKTIIQNKKVFSRKLENDSISKAKI